MSTERDPDQTTPADGLLLTVPAAASYLGVPTRRLYSWIATGRIPNAAIKRIGRAVYLVKPTLKDWCHNSMGPDSRGAHQ